MEAVAITPIERAYACITGAMPHRAGTRALWPLLHALCGIPYTPNTQPTTPIQYSLYVSHSVLDGVRKTGATAQKQANQSAMAVVTDMKKALCS